MAKVAILEVRDILPPYVITPANFDTLEACLAEPLCLDWRERVQRIVNTYFVHIPEIRYVDAKPIIRHYKRVSSELRELANKISSGPDGADAKAWTGPASAVHQIASRSLPPDRLIEQLELAASDFENAAVFTEQVSEPSPSGKKTSEALDTLVMHLAELFQDAGIRPTYSFEQNVHNSGTDKESGGHVTPFIRFINTLYLLLPAEVQVGDSASQDGPLATRARRVLRSLRERGQLKA